MTAQVLQIVPELPPRLGGVGGYALALARALRDHAGMETHFLVTDPAWRPAETGETGVTGERLPARSVRALRGALTAAGREGLPVLLHYANYAYQRRGCPFWLVRTLEIRPSHRLVTFFHEVHAGGPPWRSSFWLAPLQRHLAARLARRSDRCATSLPLYRGLLEALAPGTDAVVLPVLSPLGEPAEVAPLAARHPPRLLVDHFLEQFELHHAERIAGRPPEGLWGAPWRPRRRLRGPGDHRDPRHRSPPRSGAAGRHRRGTRPPLRPAPRCGGEPPVRRSLRRISRLSSGVPGEIDHLRGLLVARRSPCVLLGGHGGAAGSGPPVEPGRSGGRRGRPGGGLRRAGLVPRPRGADGSRGLSPTAPPRPGRRRVVE